MTATELQVLLARLGACREAQDWCEGKTLVEAWATCVRGDWMDWIICAEAREACEDCTNACEDCTNACEDCTKAREDYYKAREDYYKAREAREDYLKAYAKAHEAYAEAIRAAYPDPEVLIKGL